MRTLIRREASIERAACREARRLGIEPLKMSFGKGWPDRLFLVPGGRPVFVEFKCVRGKTTPIQDLRIARLKELG
ncbi:MAG: VRR-NUC domain-containing protein, partial [Candidatus Polarisedimenticolia bacterium]